MRGGILARMWLIVVVPLLFAAPGPLPQAPAASSDETAIRNVVRTYVSARELRDPAAFDALFTADADQHTTSGDWRRGRAQLIAGMLASSRRNPGTRSITITSVRFITADVAIADGPYEIADGSNVRRMWTTIMFRRESGRWRIAAIRNMMPAGG